MAERRSLKSNLFDDAGGTGRDRDSCDRVGTHGILFLRSLRLSNVTLWIPLASTSRLRIYY